MSLSVCHGDLASLTPAPGGAVPLGVTSGGSSGISFPSWLSPSNSPCVVLSNCARLLVCWRRQGFYVVRHSCEHFHWCPTWVQISESWHMIMEFGNPTISWVILYIDKTVGTYIFWNLDCQSCKGWVYDVRDSFAVIDRIFVAEAVFQMVLSILFR